MRPRVCKKDSSFEECELAILRSAVDNIEAKQGADVINDPSVVKIIKIIEQFLKKKKLVAYGGTAINNILPKKDQFYNKDIDLPDYDFFSPTPVEHAKELADIYFKNGFKEVEAKSGMHSGTFKVFVNYIPVADITYVESKLYENIKKDAVSRAGILYANPNYLRMAMYLELSRPKGDVSRWEKVLKRLTLLNKNYPLKGKNCNPLDIQRIFFYGAKYDKPVTERGIDTGEKSTEEEIFTSLLNTLVKEKVVFFGAYADKLYYKTISKKSGIKKIPDFDVLSDDPMKVAKIIKKNLEKASIRGVELVDLGGAGEIIPRGVGVNINNETVASIYNPLACHSYNVITIGGKSVRIASIDTMLSFYLAFLFVESDFKKNRLLCMCEYLFKAQEKNRLTQKGILKRFSLDCYGPQHSIQSIRATKNDMYEKLKNNRGSKEYEWWFLRYTPGPGKKRTK